MVQRATGPGRTPPRTVHARQAKAAGVTHQMLRGKRFVRVHEGVWRHRDHEMTFDDHIEAAQLALPADARVTGITRLQLLGLDFGPRSRSASSWDATCTSLLDGVFLHRTVRMPPLDEVGVAVVAAYVAYCSRARVIDAIKVGDWLLYETATWHGTSSMRFCLEERWRAGADEALWILGHLDGDCPIAQGVRAAGASGVRGYRDPRGQHRRRRPRRPRRGSATSSIGGGAWSSSTKASTTSSTGRSTSRTSIATPRCVATRVPYVQVTKEKLDRPQRMVREVYAALVALRVRRIPAPEFGERWRQLFARVSRRGGGGAAVAECWFQDLKPTLSHRHPAETNTHAPPTRAGRAAPLAFRR